MIISENGKPGQDSFACLVGEATALLNGSIASRSDELRKANGTAMEPIVKEALDEAARSTEFDGSIALVSGQRFPDIIARKLYGVEVKTTREDSWKSTGSSILESSRVKGVERIFMTFAKLGGDVRFRSAQYEDCLSSVAVTHYPRYIIDMDVAPGATIFSKLGIPYDTLRNLDEPAAPVIDFYRRNLKPGESLWWTGRDGEEAASPMKIAAWSACSAREKESLVAEGLALFPETAGRGRSQDRYCRYAAWLVSEKGIINPNARDGFSAGGKAMLEMKSGLEVPMPAVFGRIARLSGKISGFILGAGEERLKDSWKAEVIAEDRIDQWIGIVAGAAASAEAPEHAIRDVLGMAFGR